MMSEPKLHVYVAGPLNGSGTQNQNIRKAVDVGERLRRGGCVPFVPHLFVAQWAFLHPDLGEDAWLEMDFAWLAKCDALVRIEGSSPGSDAEVELAERLGIPVFHLSTAHNGVSELLSTLSSGDLRPRTHHGCDKYQRDALRTAGELEGLGMLNAAALGVAGEAGEFADMVKKHLYHDHPLDPRALAEELGDVLWYVALGARAVGLDLSEVARRNIAKLVARYPDGFDAERSKNR